MQLRDYLVSNNVSAYKFADLIGVSFQTVYKWLDGSRIPRRHAARIANITNGKVTPNDFYPIKQLKTKVKEI